MQITFNIPSGSVSRIVDAMVDLYPVPTDDDGTPLYTDNAWAKERIRRFVLNTVRRSEVRAALDAAEAGVNIPDNIIT